MSVSRLRDIPGIGVDQVGDAADATHDERFLRMENLDTDLPPPAIAREATRRAVDDDAANSYLPFQGHWELRQAAADHVSRIAGTPYDSRSQCVIVAGGLNGVLNTLLATVEPGQQVVIADPIYAGLVNRIRLSGAVPRHVRCRPTPAGWQTDADELAAAIGPDTAAVLLMGPAMPTGACSPPSIWTRSPDPSPVTARGSSTTRRWNASASTARLPCIRPAIPCLRERTITVGSASKELRMIGWRVGWVVGPGADRGRHRPGGTDERRLPGRHRPAGGCRRSRRARRRRRGRRGRARLARTVRGRAAAACRLPVRPATRRMVAAHRHGRTRLSRPKPPHSGCSIARRSPRRR